MPGRIFDLPMSGATVTIFDNSSVDKQEMTGCPIRANEVSTSSRVVSARLATGVNHNEKKETKAVIRRGSHLLFIRLQGLGAIAENVFRVALPGCEAGFRVMQDIRTKLGCIF